MNGEPNITFVSTIAWGNLRNPETWTGEASEAPMFDRGFTGHEMLYDFGLINMNGRMYDPIMSSFLSVDNYVQSLDFSQNFNRYAYCYNNPLKYTDPSGEIAVVDDILIAAAVGAVIGVTMNGISNSMNNVGFFQNWWKAGVVGLVGGATGAGVAALGAGAGVVGMAAGAVSGGTSAALNKTNVIHGIGVGALSGWLGGGLSQYIGGGWGALAGGMISNSIAQLPSVSQGNDFDWRQMLISGGLSCGMYLGASYCNWQFRGGNKMGDVDVSFRQFCKMQAAFQRSRAWEREMGGYLMEDGSFKRARWGTSSQIDLGTRPEGAVAEFHTHWDKPGKVRLYDKATGEYIDGNTGWGTRVSKYHGEMDFNTQGLKSLVLNRFDGSYYDGVSPYVPLPEGFIGPPNINNIKPITVINPPILRYNYGYLFSIKYEP